MVLAAYILSRFIGIKLAILPQLVYPGSYSSKLIKFLHYFYDKIILTIFSNSIMFSCSKSIKIDFEKNGKKFNFHVLNPGLGVDFEKLDKIKNKKEYDFVFFSRLTKEKGLYDLLECAKIIKINNDNFKLAIIGNFGKKIERKFFLKN